MIDTTFHFPMEGQTDALDWLFNHPLDDTVGAEFGPNAPFWRTSLWKSISEYGTTRPSYVTPMREFPSNEKLFKGLQPSIDHFHKFQEILKNTSSTPLPHHSEMTPQGYL